MCRLEIKLINNEKREIEVNSLEEALAIITEFNVARNDKTIEIKTSNGLFSFAKDKALYVEIKDMNENNKVISVLDKF